MVIFVKLTVNSQFQENKPLEPGELSTYCRSQECGNSAVVKLEKRVESKPALHSVHQGADKHHKRQEGIIKHALHGSPWLFWLA